MRVAAESRFRFLILILIFIILAFFLAFSGFLGCLPSLVFISALLPTIPLPMTFTSAGPTFSRLLLLFLGSNVCLGRIIIRVHHSPRNTNVLQTLCFFTYPALKFRKSNVV